ncbi:hypothetical protein SAMN02745823_00323 [Sporobacter termitidis DSM 10068]|uniref:Uncharacterized protein n=1 Tax=Sporobacter termitidis DSM 10068 TaxID=1123282 RepID=A0A1M5U286_9FIRM|nr:hypothetical protein [Sporobacter termitidis]SHH56966.1 hypothetical protein SAMN02745823_00323 [Sporobacter termitidis DSM 10068]
MGVYYDFYSEVLVDNKWVNIDSYVLGLDGEYHHCLTISGKSYLREAIDNSDEYNHEVKTRKFEAFDFQTAIKDQLRGPPIMRGFVDRHYIAAFQRRDIDSIEEWLTATDYASLDKPEQQAYSYYEWDDREGWYAVFKSLAARIEVLVENFNNYRIKDMRSINVKAKDVRVVICVS